MDLTRTIGYRGFPLNTIQFDAVSRDMVGCEVKTAEYGTVQGVGYEEKRAMADGTDVADIFLHKRLIALSGVLYGRTRSEAFRHWLYLADAMNPQQAWEHYPAQRGYSPLDFYMPNDDVAHFPSGLVHAMIPARPTVSLSARFGSDEHGGDDNKALAIPWSVQMDARVPDIVNYDWTEKILHGPSANEEFSMLNRGNRKASVELQLVVPGSFGNGGTGHMQFRIGSDQFQITVPHEWSAHVIRYDTHAKVLTYDGQLRMDLLSLVRGNWHPKVRPMSALGGAPESIGWYRTGRDLLANSYLRFRDTWA